MLVKGDMMNRRPTSLTDFGVRTENRTFIVAEIGINHGGRLDEAKRLIDSAAKTGVDGVKFQTYITEKRAPAGNQLIFDILKKCELPFEAFEALKAHTEQYGMYFFSTPFDLESLNCLESLDCGLYKIASFDLVNHKLLYEVAKTGKPVILSVGMAELDEIMEAYRILRKESHKIALLHCISAYPTKEEDANLAAIYFLRDHFDCVIGHSDHTPDIYVPLMAVAAGAQIIEKHYRVHEDMDCIDAAVSITEGQMKRLVNETRRLERIFGDGRLGVRPAEKNITIFRRSTKIW